MANTPKYCLKKVKGIVKVALKDDESEVVWFSRRTCSTLKIIETFKAKDTFLTELEARDYALNSLLELSLEDFSESKLINGTVKDIYGLVKDDTNWFIKFEIDQDDDLEQISFHPTTKDLELANKKILKRTGDL